MKLVRVLTANGPTWAAETDFGYTGIAWKDGTPTPTNEKIETGKLLAPVDPPAIIAIGLNYRKHAAETGAQIPQFPVVFTKGLNALSGPEDPIVLPRHLRSDKVDYECELG